MFGLSFHKPTPAELGDDEYHWTMSEQQRQERLANLRAHVQDLRAERSSETRSEPVVVTRAVPREPEPKVPSVRWHSHPPDQPGLYWWRMRALEGWAELSYRPRLCTVVDYGGRLCVRRHGRDSSTFIGVVSLARDWAGPVALPEDLAVEDVELNEWMWTTEPR
jgi:hypothetical protein